MELAINRNTRWHHVYQTRSGPKAWACWKRLCNWLCTDTTNRCLRTALGSWTVPQGESCQQWSFWTERQTYILCHCPHDTTCTSHSQLHRDFNQDPDEASVLLPSRAVPVDARPHIGTWSVKEHPKQEVAPPPVQPLPAHHTLLDHIQLLDPWEKSLLGGLKLLVTQEQLFTVRLDLQ